MGFRGIPIRRREGGEKLADAPDYRAKALPDTGFAQGENICSKSGLLIMCTELHFWQRSSLGPNPTTLIISMT